MSQSTNSAFVATSMPTISVVSGLAGNAARMLHRGDELQQSGPQVTVVVSMARQYGALYGRLAIPRSQS